MCETDTHAHTRTPDRLTRLAVRKTSIPASAAAEIPSCWLVNKAGTAFLVVNKKFQSIQSKKRERGGGGRSSEEEQANDTVTQTSKADDGDRARWRAREREQRWGRKKEQESGTVSRVGAEGEGKRGGAVRRVAAVMWADGVVWHASSALLSVLWLKKCSCSGWCWEEHSTVQYAILSTPSLHPSTFPSLICSPAPFLMSPSFLLPPLSSLARCIFGSEWQFCTARRCSTAEERWQVLPPLLAPLLSRNFNPRRRIQICSHADVYVNDGWDLTAMQQPFVGKYRIESRMIM